MDYSLEQQFNESFSIHVNNILKRREDEFASFVAKYANCVKDDEDEEVTDIRTMKVYKRCKNQNGEEVYKPISRRAHAAKTQSKTLFHGCTKEDMKRLELLENINRIRNKKTGAIKCKVKTRSNTSSNDLTDEGARKCKVKTRSNSLSNTLIDGGAVKKTFTHQGLYVKRGSATFEVANVLDSETSRSKKKFLNGTEHSEGSPTDKASLLTPVRKKIKPINVTKLKKSLDHIPTAFECSSANPSTFIGQHCIASALKNVPIALECSPSSHSISNRQLCTPKRMSLNLVNIPVSLEGLSPRSPVGNLRTSSFSF